MKIISLLFTGIILLHACGNNMMPLNKNNSSSVAAETGEPWTEKQLMPPSELAALISKGDTSLPLIFNMGPAGQIKGAINIGPAQDEANLNTLKARLEKLPRDKAIVIYCGCCPFSDCPNVRPAFSLLNSMHFTNHRLLNLSHNLKTDWIDKGYPVEE